MEFVKFLAEKQDHFWGFLLTLIVVGTIVHECIKEIRRKK
jgi:hypothetical protein